MSFPPLSTALFYEVAEEVEEEEEEVEAAEPEDDPFAGIDPMDMANEIADMREKMSDYYSEEKLTEIVCGINSREGIYEAMKTELQAFAENFVEESEVLPAVPDIEKLVDRFEDKCEPIYDGLMAEKTSTLLGAVFSNFQGAHGEEIRAEAGGDPGALDGIIRSIIDEIAREFVMSDEFLAAKGIPKGALDEQTEETVLTIRADVAQETILAAASSLYGECLGAREATYRFEMGRESELQEEWDKSGLEAELEMFDERISACADMDISTLEETEREGPIEFWKNAVAYAREELGYMRTRADYIVARGCRQMWEGYSHVIRIEGEFEKRLNYLKLTYAGGVYRQVGEPQGGKAEYVTYDIEPDERIYEVRVWETGEDDAIAQGMKFFVSAEEGREGRGLELLGTKTQGFFGGRDGCDKIWSKGGCYQIQINYEDNGIKPRGVTADQWETKQPKGDWHESVDDWHWQGNRLVYTIQGRQSYFVPLPWETLKVENGMVLVDKRLMSKI